MTARTPDPHDGRDATADRPAGRTAGRTTRSGDRRREVTG